jgi:hypothetical protein
MKKPSDAAGWLIMSPMKYSLRSLMVAVLVGPPIIAGLFLMLQHWFASMIGGLIIVSVVGFMAYLVGLALWSFRP